MPRIHLKFNPSRRLTLCGIFPGTSFKLVEELRTLSKDDRDFVCRVCLMIAEGYGEEVS